MGGINPLSKAKVRMSIEALPRPFDHVLGWWDYSKPNTPLGTLLTFLAECELVAKLCHADSIDIVVDAQSHGIKDIELGKWRLLEVEECKDAALSVLAGINFGGVVYACGGTAGFKALSAKLARSHLIWPLIEPDNPPARYDTTKYVTALWKEVGLPPHLTFRPKLREWADGVIARRFEGRPVVALHLKNIPHQAATSISLANQSAWYDFVVAAEIIYNMGFLLVGDDPVDKRMREIRSVALGRNLGATTFGKHLALLGQCQGFMGMMSAPSNLAIFSDLPYAIFKNPDHHRAEMLLEIGVNSHYPFANGKQRILRVNETTQLLLSELARLMLVRRLAQTMRVRLKSLQAMNAHL